MDWYNSYKLVEDKDGYVLEIYLNKDLPEFAAEYMSGKAEKAEKLEDKAQQLVKDKFAGVKINAVKFILGAIVIATIPFGTAKAAAPAGISQPAGKTATVTATSLNVRTGPSTSYSIMHVLWQGNKVPVIDESGGFYKIRLSDGRTGWISKNYAVLNTETSGVVTATKLNVRTGPSTSYDVMHILWNGNRVPIIDDSGNCIKSGCRTGGPAGSARLICGWICQASRMKNSRKSTRSSRPQNPLSEPRMSTAANRRQTAGLTVRASPSMSISRWAIP